MRYRVVLYGIGLDLESLHGCCEQLQLRTQLCNYPYFSGPVRIFCSDALTSASKVYQDVETVPGPKVVIVLYRHDNFKDVESLRTFLLALTCLSCHSDDTILGVCEPIPNPAKINHFEQCEWQNLALYELEVQTKKDLRLFQLSKALREPPEYKLLIPGATSFNPHRISPDCYERIAASLFCYLCEIASNT